MVSFFIIDPSISHDASGSVGLTKGTISIALESNFLGKPRWIFRVLFIFSRDDKLWNNFVFSV